MTNKSFSGLRILIAEDEYFLADEVRAELIKTGAEVVGPVATVRDALQRIEEDQKIDGALLDINLRGEMAFEVADALAERGIAFAFVTGYDSTHLPERFAGATTFQKPLYPDTLAALFEPMLNIGRTGSLR